MKAVVIRKAGGPEVLKIEERPIPKATDKETVIHIRAFAVHRYEVLTREGGSPSVKFPRVIGVEAVGEVFEPSKNSDLKKGQKIVIINGGFGREFDGGEQQYALVPDDIVRPVEFDGSWADFAIYPETFYTAFGALKTTKLQAGQTLLVRGGTTGVGMAAMVLANAMGIKVTATTRREERRQMLLDMGATDVVIDQDGKLQTEKAYDGLLDMVGAPVVSDSLAHVNRDGIYTVVGLLSGEWLWKNFDPFENIGGKYITAFDGVDISNELVAEMFKLINDNHLTIPVSKVFKLDDIQAAQEYVMKHDRPMGQVIVTTD
ncbi:zinc-binding dehydrogenase [Companilactobacillus bobalius]|uniref:NADPH:quinone reductase n=2 Tax=Companilactobacillus bobalius TaxID=2801451 RepID=A0A202FDD7_9LACO|nr:zinc-binding dehydrogenase [Companilactobacillus bobalius]KAE9556843.1 NADPH:quinone reductase [Companilactobacillus bobalius]KRK81755.1 NADPH quinone reductase related Zn-dependent oxidoreductase [Companilactobacillus bobalius DSM 19674]OVE98485.1 NADPH:quinone reductase [Companilactobacillus bobalius]GEO58864.1 oxidoreductase [Companilactobacillus paralimentarius]